MHARPALRTRSWYLKIGAVATAAALTGTVLSATPAAAATGGTANGAVQYMQIVAHPDDDVFFMNPDIYQSIKAGAASVTVYTTASEISGNGSTPAQKAKSLQEGVEDAYARMAGVPDAQPGKQEEWSSEAWTVGGRKIERVSLKQRPNVQLVFMGLHDGDLDDVYAGTLTDHTVVPTGSVVQTSYAYNKSQFRTELTAIITAYHPSVLRYQDPLPDTRYTPEHSDHLASAHFVTDILKTYTASTMTTDPYRDYNIEDVPADLSDAASAKKTEYWQDYEPYDDFATPVNWLYREYTRWPRGTQFVGKNHFGKPQAFLVRNGNVLTFQQAADNTWSNQALGGVGGQVVNTLATVANTDGTLQVFARRSDNHHIVTIKQAAGTFAWPASWQDLGNPNISLGGDPTMIGTPAVAANANGTLWLFVKDSGGGMCARHQNSVGGSWGGWQDMGGGADIQDPVAAIRGSDGRISVFASTDQNVLTWRQSAPNGTIDDDGALPDGPGYVPASPPSVTINHDGTLEVLYREADTSHMVTTYENAVGGPWTDSPTTFGGMGGTGQPAVVTAPPGSDARIMVFERNDSTGVSWTKQTAPDAPYSSWSNLSGTIIDQPAAMVDATGAVNLFAIGADGLLYVDKQASAGANSAFGGWTQIG